MWGGYILSSIKAVSMLSARSSLPQYLPLNKEVNLYCLRMFLWEWILILPVHSWRNLLLFLLLWASEGVFINWLAPKREVTEWLEVSSSHSFFWCWKFPWYHLICCLALRQSGNTNLFYSSSMGLFLAPGKEGTKRRKLPHISGVVDFPKNLE